MEERGRKFRLNTRQRERLFYGSLAVLALFVFLFVGSREPVLFDDSGAYMRIERFEGVMPIYPFFLFVNQWLFGMDTYLDFVILEQALFSTVCIVFFVKEIKNKFSLCYTVCLGFLVLGVFGFWVLLALLLLLLFWFFVVVVFRDSVSLYNSGCPGTHSVDQTGLELRNPPASAELAQ